MSKQNVFNDESFFRGYQEIRNSKDNANILIEKPAIFSILPDLKGKTVLDLGCGYGENSREFIRRGASSVVGIDLSDKMLAIAQEENTLEGASYIQMGMEDILTLNQNFDVIFSSLAMHYIKDFEELARNVYSSLKNGGYFLFSQEHPVNTCFSEGSRWTKDEKGNVLHANLYHYSESGVRKVNWFIDVIRYHRTFSNIINSLIKAVTEIS